MIFLIEYDRQRGRVVSLSTFQDEEGPAAAAKRIALELSLLRSGLSHEVVLLEAASEEALRRTHRRYFEDVDELTAG